MDEKKWLYDFRVAYRRLRKQCKENTEQYFNSVVWLGRLSQFRLSQKDGNKVEYASTFDCVRSFYKTSYEALNHRMEAALKGAKNYAAACSFSKEEAQAAQELVEKTKEKNEKALNDFITQFDFNLKLFDFKRTGNHDVETDYGYIKKVIKQLFVKNKLEIYPLEKIRIIDARGKGIGKLQKKYLSTDSSFDFLTNGTYFWHYGSLGWSPVASVITESSYFENLEEPKNIRGGFAILNSGIVNVTYTNSNRIDKIKEKFRDVIGSEIGEREIPELKEGDNTDNVFEFIGGGALLISGNKAISGEELYKIQLFDDLFDNKSAKDVKDEKKLTGFHSKQLQNAAWRIMAAKLNEIPFSLFTDIQPEKLQKNLYDLGFSELVCFDGGNETYIASKEKIIIGKGKNSPSGFAVKVERKYE